MTLAAGVCEAERDGETLRSDRESEEESNRQPLIGKWKVVGQKNKGKQQGAVLINLV